MRTARTGATSMYTLRSSRRTPSVPESPSRQQAQRGPDARTHVPVMRAACSGRRQDPIRRVRPWRLAVATILVLGALGGLLLWGVSGLGRWLVVADPLERAAAVVVLSGGVPFRAVEAAAIYRDGWVREVWITRASNPAEEAV